MELTEERLAEIEQQAKEHRIVGVGVADVLALVAEVRRLRDLLVDAIGYVPESLEGKRFNYSTGFFEKKEE